MEFDLDLSRWLVYIFKQNIIEFLLWDLKQKLFITPLIMDKHNLLSFFSVRYFDGNNNTTKALFVLFLLFIY